MGDSDGHQARNEETVRRLSEYLSQQPRVTSATRREVRLLTGVDPVSELGIPEADESELDATAIVLVVRVPAPHAVGAKMERCAVCNRRVWVARSTPPGPKRVCVVCFMDARMGSTD
ncbi:MAG TPA: hypothetical protein VGJ60_07025 [Chloroflexota bacterium]